MLRAWHVYINIIKFCALVDKLSSNFKKISNFVKCEISLMVKITLQYVLCVAGHGSGDYMSMNIMGCLHLPVCVGCKCMFFCFYTHTHTRLYLYLNRVFCLNAWPTRAHRNGRDATDCQSEDEQTEEPVADRRKSSLNELGNIISSFILPLKTLVQPKVYLLLTDCSNTLPATLGGEVFII